MPKSTKTQSPKIESDYKDFFVNFIHKRQKTYTKKQKKIQELKTKKTTELSPEQILMIENETET